MESDWMKSLILSYKFLTKLNWNCLRHYWKNRQKLIYTYVNNRIRTFIHFILQMQPSLPKQFASKAAKSRKSRRPSQAADVDQCRRLCLQLKLLPVKIFFFEAALL